MDNLPFGLLCIFASAKILAYLFDRLGQPAIIGEIVAGILIGPSVLGLVSPDQVFRALADIGVMFLLFRVGLEMKASELFAVGRDACVVATLGVIVPFFAGWAIMSVVGTARIEGIFVGACMVATSVGITAQVLAAKGLLAQRASKIILAAAVIDDVLGLLVLALVSNIAHGSMNLFGVLKTGLLAIGFTVFIALFGTRAVRRFLPSAGPNSQDDDQQLNIALVLLFALSLSAASVGVAAIIGAFLAGLSLSETVSGRVRDLAYGISGLLVPFFLVGIGMRVDVRAFQLSSTIWLTAALIVAAVATKFVACGIGAFRLGRVEALRVGVGMIPRGEVGMIVAQIGLGLGVISKPVYAAVIMMAVATTILTPSMIAYAYREAFPVASTEDFVVS